MNYAQKYFEEIFESMLQDSLEKGLISHVEDFPEYIQNQQDISNYYVMDKSVIAKMFEKFYEDMTLVYESAKVEYAEGTDLDEIGSTLGIFRPAATHAETLVTFTLSESASEDINLPEGIIISTVSGIEYETVERLFISADDNESTITARAVEAGLSGKVIENTLTRIVSNLEYNFIVNNESPSSGGREEYNDDEYRYLLMNWTKIYLKGSLEAFEYYFASFDGIDSYKLIPNWDGAGTIKCVLDPGMDYQLGNAYEDLQGSITQATEDIFMSAPISKSIDIYATVNVDIDQINPYSDIEKRDIKAKIISAIKVFIDGGYASDGSWYPGLLLGEDFIPHKLGVFLDDEIPELKNIIFNTPTDYVSILDEEVGVSNTINIEMM